MKKVTIAAVMATMISGCSSLLTVGDEEAYCPGGPSGSVCKGPREIYTMTDNKANLHDMMNEDDDSAKTSASDGESLAQDSSNNEGSQLKQGESYEMKTFPSYKAIDDIRGIEAPDPRGMLKPAKVMRVYVAAWTDSNNDLHLPGYMYVEVEPERWIIGKAVNKNVNRIVPFSVRHEAQTETKNKMNPPARFPNGLGVETLPE